MAAATLCKDTVCPEGTCAHTDCADTYEIAHAPCRYCGQPIGFDTRFYIAHRKNKDRTLDPGYVHAVCYENSYKDID